MRRFIPAPQKGQPLRADWAGAVTEAVNGLAAGGFAGTLARDGAGAFGHAPLPANLRERAYAHRPKPFEVRRFDAADDSDGAGGWYIWCTPDMLVINGSVYDISGYFPAPQGAHPPFDAQKGVGWRLVPYSLLSADGGTLGLLYSFDPLKAEPVNGKGTVPIAYCERNPDTGAVTIRQNLYGALALDKGGGCGGDAWGSGSFPPWPDDSSAPWNSSGGGDTDPKPIVRGPDGNLYYITVQGLVPLDRISTDWNCYGEVEIKGWNRCAEKPSGPTFDACTYQDFARAAEGLCADVAETDLYEHDHVIVRKPGGELVYRAMGRLTRGDGVSIERKFKNTCGTCYRKWQLRKFDNPSAALMGTTLAQELVDGCTCYHILVRGNDGLLRYQFPGHITIPDPGGGGDPDPYPDPGGEDSFSIPTVWDSGSEIKCDMARDGLTGWLQVVTCVFTCGGVGSLRKRLRFHKGRLVHVSSQFIGHRVWCNYD